MSAIIEKDKIYTAPVVFGPALCSIQNMNGTRYDAGQVKEHVKQYALSFDVDVEDLKKWIPDGLELAEPQLIVQYEHLTNVVWLAGQEFDREEVFIPVQKGEVKGLFRLISWESSGDSVIQNRDIFGKAVVYGDTKTEESEEKLQVAVSNWDFTFLNIEIEKGKAAEENRFLDFIKEAKGVYHHRYLPMTGEKFVISDADYLIYDSFEGISGISSPCMGSIQWNRPEFENAPTQYYFLQPLAELKLGGCCGGMCREFDRYNDGYEQKILQ